MAEVSHKVAVTFDSINVVNKT